MEKITAKGDHYTAVNIGDPDKVGDYQIIHPITGHKIEGKIFLRDLTDSIGTEISFNILPPYTEQPYFHKHIQNEETYIILTGSGMFQVDEEVFAIEKGSVVRVSSEGVRSMKNTSGDPMLYVVIQSKENSLEQCSQNDSERIEPVWK
ncbi:MAG: cupin domain-containing protein [Rikenellaceae bacterium]|nr:cupin domain-containing protein [Rikenellaceae bacterium]